VCGPDPKMCIYTNNFCNQEVFQILFPQFVQEAEYEKSVHIWWIMIVVLNTAFKKHTALPIIQFFQRDICIHTSLVLYILWSRIWGAYSGEDS
jgi:hypothetical protein